MHIHARILQWRQTKWAGYHRINMQCKQTEWFWYNQLKYYIASLRNYYMTAYFHNGSAQTNVIISDYINLFAETWWKTWHLSYFERRNPTLGLTRHQPDRRWWVKAFLPQSAEVKSRPRSWHWNRPKQTLLLSLCNSLLWWQHSRSNSCLHAALRS